MLPGGIIPPEPPHGSKTAWDAYAFQAVLLRKAKIALFADVNLEFAPIPLLFSKQLLKLS